MSDPNQSSSSRDPRPETDPSKEVAKGAALGCLAGFGAVGAVLAISALVIVGVVFVGVFLLFLSCSGH